VQGLPGRVGTSGKDVRGLTANSQRILWNSLKFSGTNFIDLLASLPFIVHMRRLSGEGKSQLSLPPEPHGGPRPITITVKTALELSGLGLTKLYALIKDKRLETVKIGSRRLIRYDSLERLLTGEAPVKRRPGRPRKAAS